MERNYIQGKVKRHNVRILIDTGASLSCLSLAFLNKLKVTQRSLKASQDIRSVRGVGGEIHKILGTIELEFTISGTKVCHKFYVFSNLYTPVILGFDFLEANKASIDTVNHILILHEGLAAVSLIQKSQRMGIARTTCLITMPPRTQCIVPVKISKLKRGTIALLEPVATLTTKKDLAGGKSLVQVRSERVHFLLLNPTRTHITLPPGSVVGTATVVDQSEVEEFDDPDLVNTQEKEPHACHLSTDAQPNNSDFIRKAKELDLDLDSSELNEKQREQLLTLLGQYRDIFARDITELGVTNIYEHRIDTGDAIPVRQRFYRHTPTASKEAERQIKEMLENDIIEKSTSEWQSPVVMVKKKSGELRFAVDYRRLNAVTRPMNYPLPRMENVIDTLAQGDPKFFTVLDLASGFWQIKVHKDSRHKTGFVTPQGVYQFKRLPFGISGAPGTFQMLMAEVLRDLNWRFSLVYIDDILIFSKDFELHLDHLSQVFDRLRQANLTLKISKCKFATASVSYLGHTITKDGISVDTTKTKVVQEFTTPRNVSDTRSFLGLCNYFRKFIPNFSHIANPLNQLLRKEAKFQWTNACQEAFDTLKSKLVQPPCLAFPNMSQSFELSTDASNHAIAWVLEQKDSQNRSRAINYGGRSLHGSELAWSISEKECLAVLEGIRANHPYLADGHFDVYTDHAALQWLKSIKQTTGRLARWSLLLQGYSFTIHHRPGKQNKVADALSRREYEETPGASDVDYTDSLSVLHLEENTTDLVQCDFEYDNTQSPLLQPLISEVEPQTEEIKIDFIAEIRDLRSMQRECKDCGPIIRYLELDDLPDNQKEAKRLTIEADNYIIEQDILYHLYYRRAKGLPKADRLVKQLVVPQPLRAEALQAYHDSLIGGGHQGFERTYHAVRNKYYWPKMYRDVYEHVHSCTECQQAKNRPTVKPAPLHPLPIADIFGRWHMDMLGPVTTSSQGFKHILVLTDSFSKWCEAIPTKTQEAKEIAEILYRDIFTRYGAPHTLVSDRGRNFMSSLVEALCSLFDVKRVHTSSYHPQTNSAVERFNSVIAQSIRACCKLDQKDWPDLLPGIMMSYRATPATQSTHHSPYFMVFGREMNLPFDLEWIPKPNMPFTAQKHLEKVLDNLENARKVATENIKIAQTKYKKYYDRKVKEPNFSPGDKVWLYNTKVPIGLSNKFHKKWTGPFYITQLGPNHTYKIRQCSDNKEVKSLTHANRLKLYFDPASRPVQSPFQSKVSDDQTENATEPTNQPASRTGTCNPQTEESQDIDSSKSGKEPEEVWHKIDRICACKRQNGRILYRVKWEGIPKTEWVPSENVSDYAKQQYHANRTVTGKKRKKPLGKNKFFDQIRS